MRRRDARRTPPADVLVRGTYNDADLLVTYVDEDASGELRLVIQVPEVPTSLRRCA